MNSKRDLIPWLAVADRLGFAPPIDLERRLAAMRYQGVGEDGIHAIQVSVSVRSALPGRPI